MAHSEKPLLRSALYLLLFFIGGGALRISGVAGGSALAYSDDGFVRPEKSLSCSESEVCRSLKCNGASIITASSLNGGESIYSCPVDHLPDDVCFRSEVQTEPSKNDVIDALMNGKTLAEADTYAADRSRTLAERCRRPGRRIHLGSFVQPDQVLMFYVSKNGKAEPAYSYEELAELIGGIGSKSAAKAFLSAVLGYKIHATDTRIQTTDEGYFVENAFVGSSGKCGYLSRISLHLSKTGEVRENYDSRSVIHSPDPGCPSD